MEKPDANGFVNVTWPSKNVPHGGIFHTRTVEPSTGQKEFLKVLLEEAKLTAAMRRKSALELRHHEKTEEKCMKENVRMIRPCTSHRRSLSAIRASGAFDVDSYKPTKRGEDREKLKERLANFMEFGDKGPQQPFIPYRTAKPPPKLPTKKETWNDLVTQIRERVEWLAEMEELGEGDRHREVIQDQIAERLRVLDALGVDSQCSSARTNFSGFSVLNHNKRSVRADNMSAKSGSSGRSKKSQYKQKTIQGSTKKNKEAEESVEAYLNLSPLQYTPRRRL